MTIKWKINSKISIKMDTFLTFTNEYYLKDKTNIKGGVKINDCLKEYYIVPRE